MPSILLEYQLVIRNAGDTADLFVATSVRGDSAPWISAPPVGDGAEIEPPTGRSRQGAFTGRIVDPITSGTSRAFTSITEDATSRQQCAGHKGYWKFRTNGGSWTTLVAGLVTRYALVSGIEWEIVIGDPTQVEHGQTAFGPRASTTNSTQLETIANYLARWPSRGCLFGGPIRNGFLPTLGVDKGGWTVVVDSVSSVGEVFMRVLNGYGPPQFDVQRSSGQVVSDLAPPVNDATAPYWQMSESADASVPGALTRVDEVMSFGAFPGIVVELRQLDGTLVGYFACGDGRDFGVGATDPSVRQGKLICIDKRFPGFFLFTSALSAGATQYRARAFTIQPSDVSPIYYSAHPVDFLTTVWQSLGLSVDTTTAAATKAALGNALRLSLRITAPQDLGTLLEQAVYGPLGISVRTDDTGRLVPIATRLVGNPPTIAAVITAADIRDGQNPLLFELDDSTAVKTIILKHQRFAPLNQNDMNALNGLTAVDEQYERTNADPGAIGTQTIEYDVPGMIHVGDGVPNADALANWFDGIARETFDRWGRGIITATVLAIRGGSLDGVKLGDLVTNSEPQFPNRNKRLLDDNTVPGRIMQAVRITPAPVGAEIKLADAGPNAQALTTLPTLSIAASTDQPSTVAVLTITNAAALNAASLGTRLYMAVTTGAAPAAGDYTPIASFDPGQVPATFRLPPVVAGRTPYVIARSEAPPAQPSALTAAVHVTLTALAPVTSLTATPSGSDGSKCVLAWTPPTSTQLSFPMIWIRLASQPANQAVNAQGTAPPAYLSSQFTLEGLTPGVQYTAGVQEVDPFTNDTSAIVEVTFTAGATTRTLTPPILPQFFAGSHNDNGLPVQDGTYGIAVFAQETPGHVEVWEAVETSVGSGTYGTSAAVSAPIPSVQGDWTKWSRVAPNDKLRRQLKARHIQDGATASAFTSVVTVTPWSAPTRLALSPATRVIPFADDGNYAATSDLSGQVYLLGAGVASTQKVNVGTPASPATMQRKYRVNFVAFTPQNATNATAFDKTLGDLRPSTAAAGINFVAPFVLPQGATIISVTLRGYKQNAGDTCAGQLWKLTDSSNFILATLTISATAAWTSVTNSSFSEVVGATFAYAFSINLVGVASPNDARFEYAEITVTVPDLNTGL